MGLIGGDSERGERHYRRLHRAVDLAYFQITWKETDLHVGVRREDFSPELVQRAGDTVRRLRGDIEDYIAADPVFATTLEPHPVPRGAPPIVRAMAEAAAVCGVGPMAAVAGAVAEWVGRDLALLSPDVLVENGGDIHIQSERERLVGLFAGSSPYTGRAALVISGADAGRGLGVCTSSGTVGPSLSLGCADAAIIVARSASLADAVATATGNQIKGKGDLEAAVNFACSVPGVFGALAIVGRNLAAKGRLTLRPVLSE